MNSTFAPSPAFSAFDDHDYDVEGGIAPAVLWAGACAVVVGIGVFSDAVNGVYDFVSGWNSYEPQPHVTSSISY
jgi:hypothetical protein